MMLKSYFWKYALDIMTKPIGHLEIQNWDIEDKPQTTI